MLDRKLIIYIVANAFYGMQMAARFGNGVPLESKLLMTNEMNG